MDIRSSGAKVLGNPVVAQILSSHIRFETLFNLTLINKPIRECFELFLWRDYILDRDVDEEPSPGLTPRRIQYLRSIEYRTISTGILDLLLSGQPQQQSHALQGATSTATTTTTTTIPSPLPASPVTRLTRLVFTGDRDGEETEDFTGLQLDQLLLIMKLNPLLETLRAPGELLEPPRSDQLLQILRDDLPHVKSLSFCDEVSTHCFFHVFSFFETIFGFPKLEVLRFSVEVSLNRRYSEEKPTFQRVLDTLHHHKTTGRFPEGLRELELPSNFERYPEMFLIPFFKLGFPSLTTFHVPRIEEEVDGMDFEWTMDEFMPALQHIRMRGNEPEDYDYCTIQAVIRCCDEGLESLELSIMNWSNLKITAMHQRFALKCILLQDMEELESRDVQIILTLCPNLEHFKDYDIFEIDGDDESLEPEEDEFYEVEANFSCLGLRTLYLTVSSPVGKRFHREEENTLAFYWQVGRLTELEELTLGYQPYWVAEDDTRQDFTLDQHKGRLIELQELKKLRRLHLQGLMWNKIGQAEVEWMAREWPSLERVTVSSRNRPLILEAEKSHWKWLMQKRPYLKVLNKYEY
ncbi:hypothetical protein BGZ83_006282 [Gryganskiella cystojenkinii]|nr:hypothetical protein BGZ83_006282 [Gryganskiella cystojenkinii]